MALKLVRSFFQGLCVLGYCVAPLDIAALVACFIRIIWVRAPIAIAGWAWSVWGMCCALMQVQSTETDLDCSVSELLGWRKNRTAACSTCRIPTLVSYSAGFRWFPLLELTTHVKDSFTLCWLG